MRQKKTLAGLLLLLLCPSPISSLGFSASIPFQDHARVLSRLRRVNTVREILRPRGRTLRPLNELLENPSEFLVEVKVRIVPENLPSNIEADPDLDFKKFQRKMAEESMMGLVQVFEGLGKKVSAQNPRELEPTTVSDEYKLSGLTGNVEHLLGGSQPRLRFQRHRRALDSPRTQNDYELSGDKPNQVGRDLRLKKIEEETQALGLTKLNPPLKAEENWIVQWAQKLGITQTPK